MSPNIELHIEELILHGFGASNAHQIGAAVEREITRLLQVQGLPPALSGECSVERLNAGSFSAAPGSGAAAVGTQIAQSVYTGFTT